MENVVINGIEYTPVTPGGEEKMILIVDNRGLTFVGDVDLSGDSDDVLIRNARCIIWWGTKLHLAELIDGPLEETRLGAAADVIVSRRNIICRYTCGDGWNK